MSSDFLFYLPMPLFRLLTEAKFGPCRCGSNFRAFKGRFCAEASEALSVWEELGQPGFSSSGYASGSSSVKTLTQDGLSVHQIRFVSLLFVCLCDVMFLFRAG